MSPRNFHHSVEFRVASCIGVWLGATCRCGACYLVFMKKLSEGVIGGKRYTHSVADQPKPTNDSGRLSVMAGSKNGARDLSFPTDTRESELLPRSGDVLRVTK